MALGEHPQVEIDARLGEMLAEYRSLLVLAEAARDYFYADEDDEELESRVLDAIAQYEEART